MPRAGISSPFSRGSAELSLRVHCNWGRVQKAEKCKGPLIADIMVRFPQACGFPAVADAFPSFLSLSGGGLNAGRHPCLEIRRIPWGNKNLAETSDFLIRIELRAEVIPAFQGALLIDRAPPFFVQERARMHPSGPVNLQVYGLSGVRKSSATLIDLVFKRTFFTGIHCMFPAVGLPAFPRAFP